METFPYQLNRVIPWWLFKGEDFRMSCDDSLYTLFATLVTTILVYSSFTFLSRRKRKALEAKLRLAMRTVCDLEEKLMSLEANDLDSIKKSGREIRIWMDGAFDMMHFGHMNAFRQAHALGTYLIAGVNSSETITAAKGAPVCNDEERCATVAGCKWVDEVVTGVPYVMSDEYLQHVIEKYKIDYVVHGDDPCIVNGKDVYETAQKMGKYLTIPRTEGVSTTDIVGRMLLLTKDHHVKLAHHQVAAKISNVRRVSSHPLFEGEQEEEEEEENEEKVTANSAGKIESHAGKGSQQPVLASNSASPYFLRKSNFLATSRILRLFGAGVKAPKAGDRVVYLAGGWDMFHAGHVATLEKARQLGDYVIVGVHSDHELNRRRGLNYPIMSLHERVLSVLGCKWVDDVLIDAPYCITEEMIASLKISIVVKGTLTETQSSSCSTATDTTDSSPRTPPRQQPASSATFGGDNIIEMQTDEDDPFAVPRRLGIVKIVQSTQEVSAADFVDRICLQRDHFDRKHQRKMAAESAFWEQKHKTQA